MKTAVLTRNGFVIRERENPVCGPRQVLIRTVGCGICEGEVFHYRARPESGDYQIAMGHEGSGIVHQVGEEVHEFQVGDIVTALGGAYAEYFLARPESLIKLPEGMDPRWALGEPVACCMHAMNRSGIQPKDRVAVIGCGFMGLVCLQLAKHRGAGFICAVEPISWRTKLAKQLGADVGHGPEEMASEKLIETYGEFDVVIEAAGVQAALDMCGDLVKQHGRIDIVGYHQTNGGMRTINMKQWNFKAIDVVNGHVRRDDEKLKAMRMGIELMRTGQLVTEPLATYYDLTRVQTAFDDLIARKEGLFKAVLTPGEP